MPPDAHTAQDAPTDPAASPEAPGPGGHRADDPPANTPAALPPPTRRSVWTPREKLVRLLWNTLARGVWILLPPARASLLRLFGGRCGSGCVLPRDCELTIPWHITLGQRVRLGRRSILYSLGPITVGDDSLIDDRAHLCAGTHDMTDSRFPLLKPPITVGARCLIGIDAYIGPWVELGDDCRVWPRASVYKPAQAGARLRGNPAKPVAHPADDA